MAESINIVFKLHLKHYLLKIFFLQKIYFERECVRGERERERERARPRASKRKRWSFIEKIMKLYSSMCACVHSLHIEIKIKLNKTVLDIPKQS